VSTHTSTVTFYPNLLYRDADAAMDWLQRALGFTPREVHRAQDGTVQHAEMSLGPAIVMLGTADIPLEPTDTSYGSRDFTVRDPEGNLWAFGTYRPDAAS
jgi:uncharacterized glyoxalase superfamily protein PhnB